MELPTLTRLMLALVASALPTLAHAGSACSPRLEGVREAVSNLPASTDFRVHDQLSVEFDQALEREDSDPADCVARVERMEAVLRRHGASPTPAGGPAPAVAVPSRAPPRATPTMAGARDVRALDAYIAATKKTQVQLVAYFGGRSMPLPPAVQEFQAAADESVSLAQEVRDQVVVIEPEVIVNDRMDQLHAQLEDAFMALEDAALKAERFYKMMEDSYEGSDAEFQQALAGNDSASNERRAALVEIDRLRDLIALELDTGDYSHRLPGYKEASLKLSRRQRAEMWVIDQACEEAERLAHGKLAVDFSKGLRASAALTEGIQSCAAKRTPLAERHEREIADLERRYTRTVPKQAAKPQKITPVSAPPTSQAAADEDLLAPLVR